MITPTPTPSTTPPGLLGALSPAAASPVAPVAPLSFAALLSQTTVPHETPVLTGTIDDEPGSGQPEETTDPEAMAEEAVAAAEDAWGGMDSAETERLPSFALLADILPLELLAASASSPPAHSMNTAVTQVEQWQFGEGGDVFGDDRRGGEAEEAAAWPPAPPISDGEAEQSPVEGETAAGELLDSPHPSASEPPPMSPEPGGASRVLSWEATPSPEREGAVPPGASDGLGVVVEDEPAVVIHASSLDRLSLRVSEGPDQVLDIELERRGEDGLDVRVIAPPEDVEGLLRMESELERTLEERGVRLSRYSAQARQESSPERQRQEGHAGAHREEGDGDTGAETERPPERPQGLGRLLNIHA